MMKKVSSFSVSMVNFGRMAALALPMLAAQPAWAVKIYHTGNSGDVVTPTSQAICLAGGGSDDEWSEGWKYLLERSGGGDVVIIRADGNRGGYEPWLYSDPDNHGFPQVDSVTTIVIGRASDANLASVESAILNAELVFFAGGDQSKYIDFFRGSRLMAAVEHVMNVKKVPIGGTSAGMALLAGIDYAAHYGSPTKKSAMVSTTDVINDPTGAFVDLDRTVLVPPFMKDVITDSHFSQRAREGRLVGFMARAVYNNYGDVNASNVKGIGADEGTAVCYDSTGVAQVFGANKAFFLIGNSSIERIQSGLSLDWYAGGQAVRAYVIPGSSGGSASFNLDTWQGSGGTSQFWFVNGANEASPFFGIF